MRVIATERTHLREWSLKDLDAMAAMWADRETMRWVAPWRPMMREESSERLAAMINHERLHGFGIWAVDLRETGALIGGAGLKHLEDTEEIEMGWLIARHLWGQGLGTEVARGVLRFGFERLGMTRIAARVHPDNEPSRRIIDGLGMRLERTLEFQGVAQELWVASSP